MNATLLANTQRETGADALNRAGCPLNRIPQACRLPAGNRFFAKFQRPVIARHQMSSDVIFDCQFLLSAVPQSELSSIYAQLRAPFFRVSMLLEFSAFKCSAFSLQPSLRSPRFPLPASSGRAPGHCTFFVRPPKTPKNRLKKYKKVQKV